MLPLGGGLSAHSGSSLKTIDQVQYKLVQANWKTIDLTSRHKQTAHLAIFPYFSRSLFLTSSTESGVFSGDILRVFASYTPQQQHALQNPPPPPPPVLRRWQRAIAPLQWNYRLGFRESHLLSFFLILLSLLCSPYFFSFFLMIFFFGVKNLRFLDSLHTLENVVLFIIWTLSL